MERNPSLSSATTLLVIAGTGYNPQRRRDNRVLHSEPSPDAIARIGVLLTTLGDGARDWMEWPAVSLVFIEGKAVLAEYGVLSGCTWVRTPSDGDRAPYAIAV